MDETQPSILVDHIDRIAIITLNRPDRRNGVTVEMCQTMERAMREVAQSEAHVVLVRGAGRDFCVGADIMAASEGGLPPHARDLGPIHRAATLLHSMPQVTIAAIDGGCAGAGMGWAAACDIRIASTRAKFATAFLTVGVSGDMSLPWSLTRILGGAKARELLLLPDKFDAAEALRIGLVSSLHEADELHEKATELAERLCGYDPFALRLMKANCLSAERLGMEEYAEIEMARHLQCFDRPGMGADMKEAFLKAKGD